MFVILAAVFYLQGRWAELRSAFEIRGAPPRVFQMLRQQHLWQTKFKSTYQENQNLKNHLEILFTRGVS